MTATDDHDQGNSLPLDPETERCHRYQVNAAMNAVIRTCRDVVNHHSHRGFWTPTGDDADAMSLVDQARTTVLADLHRVLDCAESVLRSTEETHKQPNSRTANSTP